MEGTPSRAKGARIDKFSMEVNGKMQKAELLDSAKARKIYEDIVRKALDPALFEYAGQSLFKVRIFPIEPRKEKEVKINYTEILERDGKMVRTFTTSTPRNTPPSQSRTCP